MEEYMKEARAHRDKNERRELIETRKLIAAQAWTDHRILHPTDWLMPGIVEVFSWDLVKKVIHLPNEVPVQAESFTPVFEELSDSFSTWRQGKMHELFAVNTGNDFSLRQLPSYYHLQLATTVFSCDDSQCIHWRMKRYHGNVYPCMWFPEFIHHPCNTMRTGYSEEEEEGMADALKLYGRFEGCFRRKWTPDTILFDRKASRTVTNILDACGLDSGRTMVVDLDRLDPKIVCLKCSYGAKCDGERIFQVMSWRAAVGVYSSLFSIQL